MMIGKNENKSYDFVGRERHTKNLVGKVWRVVTPETIRVGDCFLKGRLKSGDLLLCVKHSGDCFQDYIFIDHNGNAIPKWSFGSYGIGDSECMELDNSEQKLVTEYLDAIST